MPHGRPAVGAVPGMVHLPHVRDEFLHLARVKSSSDHHLNTDTSFRCYWVCVRITAQLKFSLNKAGQGDNSKTTFPEKSSPSLPSNILVPTEPSPGSVPFPQGAATCPEANLCASRPPLSSRHCSDLLTASLLLLASPTGLHSAAKNLFERSQSSWLFT